MSSLSNIQKFLSCTNLYIFIIEHPNFLPRYQFSTFLNQSTGITICSHIMIFSRIWVSVCWVDCAKRRPQNCDVCVFLSCKCSSMPPMMNPASRCPVDQIFLCIATPIFLIESLSLSHFAKKVLAASLLCWGPFRGQWGWGQFCLTYFIKYTVLLPYIF